MTTHLPLLRALLSLALLAGLSLRALAAEPSALAGLLDQLTSASKSTGDAQLKSLGGDLASKAGALGKSLGKDPAGDQLSGALQSLLGGKSAESLAAFGKLANAKLTPAQTKLAKETWNVGSAYVVQKNFGALESSQGDVAQIVTSLRKGEATKALPAIQKVAKEAKLTPGQKDLLTSIADQYAPGIGKVGGALDGLKKSVPGLGK